MISVTLHGPLKDKFGGEFRFDIRSAGEAVRALASQKPGFREEIEAGSWVLVDGDIATGRNILEEDLGRPLRTDQLHILPNIEGEKGEGKAILGTILMVTAVFMGGTFFPAIVFNAGLSMFMSGMSMMLAPSPERSDDKKKESFAFQGQVNVNTQGVPVPCVYGRFRVGSVVISSGVTTEKIAYYEEPVAPKPGVIGSILNELPA